MRQNRILFSQIFLNIPSDLRLSSSILSLDLSVSSQNGLSVSMTLPHGLFSAFPTLTNLSLSCLSSLTFLNCSPDSFLGSSIRHLDISSSSYADDEDIFLDLIPLSSLQTLSVSGSSNINAPLTFMSSIASWMARANLSALSSLELDLASSFRANDVPLFPSEVGLLTNLQSLTIRRLSWRSMPTEIGRLSKLGFFKASGGGPSSLPTEIGLLTSLEVFLSDWTSFTGTLPSEIARLPNLRRLVLVNTNLSGPLPSLVSLTKLEELNLEGGQFRGSLIFNTDFLMNSRLSKCNLKSFRKCSPVSNCFYCFDVSLTKKCFISTCDVGPCNPRCNGTDIYGTRYWDGDTLLGFDASNQLPPPHLPSHSFFWSDEMAISALTSEGKLLVTILTLIGICLLLLMVFGCRLVVCSRQTATKRSRSIPFFSRMA